MLTDWKNEVCIFLKSEGHEALELMQTRQQIHSVHVIKKNYGTSTFVFAHQDVVMLILSFHEL